MNIQPLFLLSALLLFSCGGIHKKKDDTYSLDVTPDPPKVGQWFQYEHSGPRPWGESQVDSSGIRLIRVIGKQNEGKKSFWAVEETFDTDRDEQTSLYDDHYLLHRQLSVSNVVNAVYEYNPPISERYIDLSVNDTKEQQSTITMQNPNTGNHYGTITLTKTTTRKRDERIVTKAGAYLCRHFISETKLIYENQGTVTEYNATEDSYWCDQIGWFVMERVEFKPTLQEGNFVGTGHVSESILVDFEQNP